ncbi:MAG: GNAT family N-acetyltransferase [Johnsonella sp.]|nr:GNAT family N-acetyltransferase [Johnsonella sp.]
MMKKIKLSKIQREYRLKSAQKEELKKLVDCCTKKEGLHLGLDPEDEEALYFLGFHSENLICASALFEIEKGCFEYISFTHPAYRRRGCFTLLWKEVLSHPVLKKEEEISVDILSDSSCPAGAAAAASLGANIFCTEHYFYLDAKNQKNSLPVEKIENLLPGALILEEIEENLYRISHIKAVDRDFEKTNPLAFFSLIKLRDKKTAYFYGFEILPPYKGRGLGDALFAFIKSTLIERGYERIELQVKDSNLAAMKIYQNAGFRKEYSISYHRILIKKKLYP